MTVEELLIYGKKHCHSDHAKILLADLLGCNPLELLNHLNTMVSDDKCKMYKEELLALEEGRPIQYVTGKVNFYGNQFLVNEDVLIPRFETEQLVEKTIEYINRYFTDKISVIDLGCGTGAIGITLSKKLDNVDITLLDISKKALNVAYRNALYQEVDAKFIESDMFSKVALKYDVIISNPPYIKNNEEIEDIVKNNEPSLALYGGEDGLDLYIKILKDIKYHMNDRCLVAFEIGATQGRDVYNLIQKYLPGEIVEIKKDLAGRDRMVFILHNLEEII